MIYKTWIFLNLTRLKPVTVYEDAHTQCDKRYVTSDVTSDRTIWQGVKDMVGTGHPVGCTVLVKFRDIEMTSRERERERRERRERERERKKERRERRDWERDRNELTLNRLWTDLDPACKRLVRFGQLGVGSCQSFNLDFQFRDVSFELLFVARNLGLVLGLHFDDRLLQFLHTSLTRLSTVNKYKI